MTTSSANNSVFRGFFEKQKLTGPNFIDWYRQLRIVLSIEDKLNYLEQPLPPAPVAPAGQHVAPEILAAHTAWVKGSKEIAGLMLMTMEPEIQRNLENLHANDMLKELKTLFAQQAEQELLQTTRDFHSCKQEEGQSVSSYVLKMKGYIDNLERLGHPVTLGLAVSLILIGLRKEFDGFVQNYNMHSLGKTVNELHAMLKLHEQTLPKNNAPALHAIRAGKVQKGKKHNKPQPSKAARGQNQGNGKNKHAYAPNPRFPLHPRGKIPQSTQSVMSVGLRASRKLKSGALSLYVGNGQRKAVEAIGNFDLSLLSRLVIVLNNCHYALSITSGVISVSHLYKDGFINRFVNNTIQVSRNNMVYFSAIPRDENSLITQKASGSLEDLKIIQEEDMHPSIDTSLNHEEDDLEIDEPQNDIIPIRRSTRTRHAPDRMCLYIDAEEHDLGDLGEPANYKAALLDLESNKWLNAMNVEMQSMKDNEVWDLVCLPPNGKTVGSKWLFKKKTDMDGAVHTYKARLVAKGYTQTPGIDYEETFSLVADIRAIRILLAIAAFYDYEIWCFAMKYLGEAAYIHGFKIYRDRSRWLIGLCQSAYIEKILKRFHMENSKRGSISMQDKLRLSKLQDVLALSDVRCTRPDVAFAQNITSQFQQNPCDLHWTTVKNILKYLRNTKDMFLVYRGDIKRELRVSCYTDAGYLTDADDLKSQSGYVFVLNGGAVDWKSAKQSIFATSSAEAEYIAAFDASKEAVWVRKFFSGLGVVPTIEKPINMYCDNTGTIAIANESGITKGARHFRAKVHYLCKVIEFGDIKLEKFHTYDNLADPFTKALAFPKHSELTRNIGMLPSSSLM
ncbi:zinc finger, CCHC-type containing protein [Tanacetum coccineum]